MSSWDEDRVPPELEGVEQRLREFRPEVSALELDQMKQRVRARAFASRPKGSPLRSRLIAVLATGGLLVGGTGGVLAESHDGNGGDRHNGDNQGGDGEHSAGDKQYCNHGSHATQCVQGSQTNQSHGSNQGQHGSNHGGEQHGHDHHGND
jgi:hypothetical protein